MVACGYTHNHRGHIKPGVCVFVLVKSVEEREVRVQSAVRDIYVKLTFM